MILPLTTVENLPPGLADQMLADAGRGVSKKPEDAYTPILYVLQTGSPACDRRGGDYVEGAEPGHFFLRGHINPIRDGKEGLEVIPCGMVRVFLEWLPGRQGLVGRHDKMPSDAELRTVKDGGYERQSLVRGDSGNIIQDTREYCLLIEDAAYVLPCSSTRHTFARQWQSYFHQIKDPKTGVVLPSFARRYLLKTVSTSNAMGRWFGLKFEDLGWIDMAQYQTARALADFVERGAMRVELPMDDGDVGAPRALPQAPAA